MDDCKNRVAELEMLAAAANDENTSTEAMVELARIYGNGTDGVQADLAVAYEWADQAMKRGSAQGALEFTRVMANSCINASDLHNKRIFAACLLEPFDEKKVRAFGLVEIARNMGTVCEYMSCMVRENPSAMQSRTVFREIGDHLLGAEIYFALAIAMGDTKPGIEKALARVKHQREWVTKPAFRTRAPSPGNSGMRLN